MRGGGRGRCAEARCRVRGPWGEQAPEGGMGVCADKHGVQTGMRRKIATLKLML